MPTHLNKMALMLSKSLKTQILSKVKESQDFLDYIEILSQTPSCRSEKQKDRLTVYLSSLKIFKNMEFDILKSMCARLEIARQPKDHIVFYQGDLGKKYFILLQGQVKVLIGQMPVAMLEQGQGFGEMGIMTDDSKRQATI
jgi:CRP-like cAMP-binding protein